MTAIILTLVISFIGFFAPVASNLPREPQWRKIVLMRSTRDDVERLLGRSQDRGFSAIYTVDKGRIRILYYPFQYCEPRPDAYLNVPQWTVVELTYEPDNSPKLRDLKLDLKKFRKVRESFDVPDLISYVNDEDGVDYTFQADKTLSDIRYFPARRYDSLRCTKEANIH